MFSWTIWLGVPEEERGLDFTVVSSSREGRTETLPLSITAGPCPSLLRDLYTHSTKSPYFQVERDFREASVKLMGL